MGARDAQRRIESLSREVGAMVLMPMGNGKDDQLEEAWASKHDTGLPGGLGAPDQGGQCNYMLVVAQQWWKSIASSTDHSR